MKFKRKHTEGPFKTLRFSIVAKDGSIIAQIVPWDESGCREEDTANLRGMMMFDVMIDYLIERAKEINQYLNDVEKRGIGLGRECFIQESNELAHLLEILKAAGVEVEI